MSNVIGFLERMGQDASLRDATRDKIEETMHEAHLQDDVRSAILGEDSRLLSDLLGARAKVYCLIAPSRKEDDEEEEPAKDDDEIRSSMQVAPRVQSFG